MILKISYQEMIDRIGHDGSEHVFKSARPWRAFHIQECVQVAYKLGYATTHFEVSPYSTPDGIQTFLNPTDFKIEHGVLLGQTKAGQFHAVATDGRMIYDSNNTVYSLESGDFKITDYYAIDLILPRKIKS